MGEVKDEVDEFGVRGFVGVGSKRRERGKGKSQGEGAISAQRLEKKRGDQCVSFGKLVYLPLKVRESSTLDTSRFMKIS